MKYTSISLIIIAAILSSCSTVDYVPSYKREVPQASLPPLGAVRSGELLKAPKTTDATRRQKPRNPNERPGLATKFGETISSPYQRSSFVRSQKKPSGTDLIYYNSKKGIEAMTHYRYRNNSMQKAAGGLLEWGIQSDGFGRLKHYQSRRDRFVAGKDGQSYKLVLKNLCKSRLEVVASVDGLDVLDGKPASVRKRGYVIPAGETLEIKGWRTSPTQVARFRFSSVGASYANQRHGDARNVGVVGIAVYGEKGVDPWTWMPQEVQTRQQANPFATKP